LQIESFDDATQGIATLRDCLEGKPNHEPAREALEKQLDDRSRFEEVAEILEAVYRDQKQHDRLVELLKRRVSNVDLPRERVRLRLDLARVVEEQIQDARRAQTILEEALVDDPADPDVLAELERIAPITDGFRSAAEALSNAIAKSESLAPETACDLYVRLADWYQNRLEDRRAAESAFEKAFAKSPESIEILRSLEMLRREPGREQALVETLRTRAKLELEPAQKRELLREAKVLAETAVNDKALAESVLRQMLDDNDADEWALAELTLLREAAGDYAETAKLLLRSAEVAPSGEEIAKLKHRAATVRREKLDDAAGAIELYEELFDNEPTDTQASDALRPLYTAGKMHRELARLLERLVDVADAQADRTRLRIELATLQATELDAASDAIDALRTVLDDEPGHPDAVVALSQLYEKTGKDDDLAELLTTQIAVAEERGDTSAELAFRVRLGEIYETRLGNAAKALETFEAVLSRDAGHKGALRALARIHQAKGDAKASAQAMQRLLDVEEGDELEATIVKLADAYLGLKDDEGALAALERGDRTHEPIRDRLRKLYEKMGAHLKLAQILEGDAEADETPAGKIRLLRQAADIHADKLSDPTTAAALLEKASELAPDDRELLLALCDAYTASGRSDDAIVALERIVQSYGGKRSKDLSAIQYRLGKAFLSKGDKDRALTELDAAFKIDPGSVPVLRDLGLLTFEMGDYERAGKTFRSLLLQRDTSGTITKAEVFYYLGEISHRQGDKAKAIQMLERSVEADSGFEKARTLLTELKG
jgi:golgin subfamily B member 1